MMKTIYKYPIEITDEQVVEMPVYARILGVQMQGDNVNIWALVDTELPTLSVKIRVLGTGNPIAAGLQLRYIGTVCGVFVWHVFIDDTEGVNCVTKN
jgi:hypothetical protein